MKKKNILTLVLALVLVAALAVGGTLAYFTDTDEAGNTFTMGNVNINLKESDDEGATWEENGLTYGNVLPGNEEKKMARVTVETGSADCYVMVKVEVVPTTVFNPDTGTGFTQEDVNALYAAVRTAIGTTNWTVTPAEGGPLQCVYNGTATAGQDLDLFTTITIPIDFGNNVAGQAFSINLTAYAIQSDNVTLDDVDWNDTFEIYPVPTAEPQN